MDSIENLLKLIPLHILILACLTIGLAPFTPPHLYEKIMMIIKAQPLRPIDWFDLFMHATPWLLLLAKLTLQKSASPL